jgi:hypothetical protein
MYKIELCSLLKLFKRGRIRGRASGVGFDGGILYACVEVSQ